MSDEMPRELEVDLSVRMARLEERQSTILHDVHDLRADVKSLLSKWDKAEGGWKAGKVMVAAVAAAVAAAVSFISKLLPPF